MGKADSQPSRSQAEDEHLMHRAAVSVFHESEEVLAPHPQLSHTEHLLTYLVKGTISLEHGQTLTIPPGAITLVPAGAPHRLLGGKDVEIWGLGFCAPCVGLDEAKPLMRVFRRVRLGALPIVPIASARRRRLLQLFRQLDEECSRNAEDAPELAQCLLKLILGEVCRAQQPEGAGATGSLVSDALSYIQQNCFQPISLRDVAAAVHRTPAHVATSVKEATGFSVGRWIAAGKAAEAAARLAHTDDSLDEIALHIGWQDKTHFIRQFKKLYGVTPAAWRRTQRDRHAPPAP